MIKFNSEKCNTMHFGHSNPQYMYNLDGNPLNSSDAERDLGVLVSKNFKFGDHISKIASRANSIVGRIKRTFSYMDKEMFKSLFNTMVRPHLEYCVQSWSPYLQKDIRILEQVQRRATNIVPELQGMQYEDRLKALGLTSLEDRRIRGDMIEVYKLLNGLTNVEYQQFFQLIPPGPHSTRGHNLKLMRPQVRTERRKQFFSVRVVRMWNELPAEVVNSSSLNSFKTNYDKYARRNIEPERT